jgi:hypothetical protein
MKRISIFLLLFAVTLGSCKKGLSPEGPSDIRIKNLTDQTFEEISVDTSGGTNEYDAVAPGQYSDYKRFDKAYPIAEVTIIINGETYSTGPQNYNYWTVLGQGKFAYEVYIENPTLKKLKIQRVIPEAPLD